ncbi:hypothetical protein H5410_003432 [Solanum commersonii]|uniref:Uncharacterized protein n=1 Tax=Solanum commersonii TaxID=4109 RepID=A0A9J6B519_SOLCO|nr:hypothetical protein H5410_003432 [Solanum commersonii]
MTRRLSLLLSHRRLVLAFSIFMFRTIGWYSTASWNYSAKRHRSFHHFFDPLPLVLRILEQRVKSVLLANCQKCLAILRL